MRCYEMLYIVHPEKAGEAFSEVVEKFKTVIEEQGASVLKIDEWGDRKLAYPIQKQARGSYVLMIFEAPAPAIKELERRMRIDESIMRYQTVLLEGGYEAPAEVPVEEVAEEAAPAPAEEAAPAPAEKAGE